MQYINNLYGIFLKYLLDFISICIRYKDQIISCERLYYMKNLDCLNKKDE